MDVWNVLILLSHLFDSLATYRILVWKFFSFRNSKTFSYCFLPSVEKSETILIQNIWNWSFIYDVSLFFVLFCFVILSLDVCKLFSVCNVPNFTIMYLGWSQCYHHSQPFKYENSHPSIFLIFSYPFSQMFLSET